MDNINMPLETLQEVLLYFIGDDLIIDILQEIVDAGLDSTNSADDIILYLQEVGYERA